jgi:hypothetical protein
MSIFQLILMMFVSLILLSSLVGYSVCVLAGSSDADLMPTTKRSKYARINSDLHVTQSEGTLLEVKV